MKPKVSRYSFVRSGTTALFAGAFTLCVSGMSQAAEYNWRTAITGDFNTAANWTIGAGPAPAAEVPGAPDSASVSNGGTAQWTANAAKTVTEIRAGNGGGGTIQISGGNTFTSGGLWAGRQNATSTGTVTISGAGTVFNNSGLTIVGGGSTAAGTLGSGATGILNISNGAVYNQTSTATDGLGIGDSRGVAGNSGTYTGTLNVDGGTLNIPGGRLYVGATNAGGSSVGEVNITGNGAINVNNSHAVIGRRGGNGKLNLSSGTLTKAGTGNFIVGDATGDNVAATGTVVHSGGTLAVNSGQIIIGAGAGSNGAYTLSGTASIVKPGAGDTAIGQGGATGSLTQTGGTFNSTNGEFFVGNEAGSNGTYNLSGGSVSVNNWIAIGRNGANGTMTVSSTGSVIKTGNGNLVIGTGNATNQGTLNVTGGLVNLASALWVGEGSNALAAISGSGEVRASAVQVAVSNTPQPGILRLNGGTLRTGRIFGGGGIANVEFNGTVIYATANEGSFLANLDSADIKANGAIIDTNGFNVSSDLLQVITGTGGLTKQGLGTLTLAGADTYAGATAVTGGKLAVTTASLVTSTYSVSTGATLGVNVLSPGQKITPSAVTVNASSIDINYDQELFSNPTVPAIDISGALTINGAAATTLINVTATPLALGQFPLIKYGSLAGASGFSGLKINNLPTGVTATLVNNTTDKTIYLNVTKVSVPNWRGYETDVWDKVTENWENTSTQLPTRFTDGDPVYFTDNALQYFDITLPGTVLPRGVYFSNEFFDYSITGAGKISGTTGVTKSGTGVATIGTTNDYAGVTRLEGGVLSVPTLTAGGVAGPLGGASAAAANLVLAGGTLRYTGSSATFSRGYTSAGGGGIDVSNAGTTLTLNGAFVTNAASPAPAKKGLGTLAYVQPGALTLSTGGNSEVQAGKLVFNGTGTTPPQTVSYTNDLWVGSIPGSGAALEVTGSSVNIAAWFAIGRGTGSNGAVSNVTLGNSSLSTTNLSIGYNNGIGTNLGSQLLTVNNSTLNVANLTLLGENRGSTSDVLVSGNSTLNIGSLQMALGGGPALGASSSTMTVGDSSVVKLGSETVHQYASIGRNGGTGHLILKNNAVFTNYDDFTLGEENGATGKLTIQDSASITVQTTMVGRNGGNFGIVTQSGGTFTSRDLTDVQIGQFGTGTWDMTAGRLDCAGWLCIARYGSAIGTANISGGTFHQIRADRALIVGEEGTAALNLSGTGVVDVDGEARIGQALSAIGSYNQTAGTSSFAKSLVLGDGGNAKGTLVLGGGTLGVGEGQTGSNLVVGLNGTASGTVTVSGSSVLRLNNGASIQLGAGGTSANNTFTQSGGTITTYSDNGTTIGGTGALLIGAAGATGTNTYKLNGGTLTARGVTSLGSTSVFVFGGGTLRATADNANFVGTLTQASVEAGGAIIDSGAHNVGIVSGLKDGGGNGGLTKQGTGNLTLSGVNTYLGNTTVSAGTVTLADDAQLKFFPTTNGTSNRINGTGTVALNGDFNIELSGAAVANGNSWTLVDPAVSKTYGSTFTVIGFTKSGNVWSRVDASGTWSFSESSGVLTLTSGGSGNAYSTWISGYFPGSTDPAVIGATADPDGDGVPNALEFALGGLPNSGSDRAKVYALQADTNSDGSREQLITIAVRSTVTPAFGSTTSPTATTTDGLTVYTIQGTLDLVNFNGAVSVVTPAVTTGLPGAPQGYEYRTFKLDSSNGLTGKGFLRVRVSQ